MQLVLLLRRNGEKGEAEAGAAKLKQLVTEGRANPLLSVP